MLKRGGIGLIRKVLYVLIYRNKFFIPLVSGICLAIVFLLISLFSKMEAKARAKGDEIQPVSIIFNVPLDAMEQVLDVVVKKQNRGLKEMNFVNLISLLAAKYGGHWGDYHKSDLDVLVSEFKRGATEKELASPYDKTYRAFKSFYEAVFNEAIGPFKISKYVDKKNIPVFEEKFGLKSYFPIAYDFDSTFLDDYEKENKHLSSVHHLGIDLNAKLNTPVVAVESGIVKECGKTRDFGWQVSIQSLDGNRTYYYANCSKEQPFASEISPNAVVEAGQVVAYVGATSCCRQKVIRAQNWPHLHFGMSVTLKNGSKQTEVFINPHNFLQFLQHHQSVVVRSKTNFGFENKYIFKDPTLEDYLKKHNKTNKR